MSERTVKEASVLDARSTTILASITKLQNEIHDHLVDLVYHAKKHGNVVPLQHFVEPMPESMRTATIKLWIVKYTPITKEKNVWRMKDTWRNPESWKLEEAEAKPYWTLGPEKDPTPMSIKQLLGMLRKLPEQIDRKEKATDGKPHLAGDVTALREFANELYVAAAEAARKYTPVQRGEVKAQTNVVQLPATIPGNEAVSTEEIPSEVQTEGNVAEAA